MEGETERAVLRLRDAATWNDELTNDVANWLRGVADSLQAERREYAQRFRATYSTVSRAPATQDSNGAGV